MSYYKFYILENTVTQEADGTFQKFICDRSNVIGIDLLKLYEKLDNIKYPYNFVLLDTDTMKDIADRVPKDRVAWMFSGIYYEYSPSVIGIYTTNIKYPKDIVEFYE